MYHIRHRETDRRYRTTGHALNSVISGDELAQKWATKHVITPYSVAEPERNEQQDFKQPDFFNDFKLAIESQVRHGLKITSYGTIIYTPCSAIFDFGEPRWPSKYDKKKVCSRVLLVNTWIDGCFGLPGGTGDRDETCPLNILNREFREEVGFDLLSNDIGFAEEDFCFAAVRGERMFFFFAKTTTDEALFDTILRSSVARGNRKEFVNDIFCVQGLPLWVESGEVTHGGQEFVHRSEQNCNYDIYGLPRILLGGMLTPSLQNNNVVRDDLLAILVKKDIIPLYQMRRRVFDVATKLFQQSPLHKRPLIDFDVFTTRYKLT